MNGWLIGLWTARRSVKLWNVYKIVFVSVSNDDNSSRQSVLTTLAKGKGKRTASLREKSETEEQVTPAAPPNFGL